MASGKAIVDDRALRRRFEAVSSTGSGGRKNGQEQTLNRLISFKTKTCVSGFTFAPQQPQAVMAGLVPAIHDFASEGTSCRLPSPTAWMAGTGPAMTDMGLELSA